MELELENTCFLCQRKDGVKVYQIAGTDSPLSDIYRIICPRCGMYKITDTVYDHSLTSKDDYLLSGLVRELNGIDTKNPKTEPTFTTKNIETSKNSYPVPKASDIEGKAKKFLERIKERTDYFGQSVDVTYDTDYPLAYAQNDGEFVALLKFLEKRHLISSHDTNATSIVTLSPEGWKLVGSLEPKNNASEQGFVAAWFHESTNESIDAIQEAIAAAGYTPLCIRDEHFSEKIMDKALGEIRKSRFLVVDLTGARSSVFFEAGFAFGLGLDVIYVYKEDEQGKGLPPEFYVRHYQCYKYKDVPELKEILSNAISARITKRS